VENDKLACPLQNALASGRAVLLPAQKNVPADLLICHGPCDWQYLPVALDSAGNPLLSSAIAAALEALA